MHNSQCITLYLAGREEEARTVLRGLRGQGIDMEAEIQSYRTMNSRNERGQSAWQGIKQPEILKPTVILSVLFILAYFSGEWEKYQIQMKQTIHWGLLWQGGKLRLKKGDRQEEIRNGFDKEECLRQSEESNHCAIPLVLLIWSKIIWVLSIKKMLGKKVLNPVTDHLFDLKETTVCSTFFHSYSISSTCNTCWLLKTIKPDSTAEVCPCISPFSALFRFKS